MKKHKNKHILNLEQERAIKLAEMGAQLRACREEQSISLEEIAAKTLIRVRLLHAIEEGRIEQLPEPVYIQGFLLRFADTLGLDGAAFASDFPIGGGWREFKFSWRNLPLVQLRPIHLYLIYIFLIIGAVKGLSDVMSTAAIPTRNLDPKPAVVPIPNRDKATGTQVAQAGQVRNASLSSTRSPFPGDGGATDASKPVRVDLTFKDKSWVRVEVDGKMEFEGELPEGTQRTWEAKQQVVVVAGNAGGILLAVNDGQAKQMGKPGEVEQVTLKAKNPRS